MSANSALSAAVSALILVQAGLSGVAAQSPRPAVAAPANVIACPPTLVLSVEKVAALSSGDPKDAIAGFTPSFTPNTLVRLQLALVSLKADPDGSFASDQADNADIAKPGEAQVWTIWQEGETAPSYAAFATCGYEGGYTLQRALPKATRSCSLQEVKKEPTATSETRRPVVSKAVFTCRS